MKILPKLRELRLLAFGTAACMTASVASANIASSFQSSCQDVQALKSKYLRCEYRAQTGPLDTSEITHCSETYYRLKAIAFQDDFAKIREWYEINKGMRGLDALSISESGHLVDRLICD